MYVDLGAMYIDMSVYMGLTCGQTYLYRPFLHVVS